MKMLVVFSFFISTLALNLSWAQNSTEYRAEYDQSVAQISHLFNEDIQKILMKDEVGKSLMFLPITKVEIKDANTIEVYTEYCSKTLRVMQYRGGMSGRLPIALSSISGATCSGD